MHWASDRHFIDQLLVILMVAYLVLAAIVNFCRFRKMVHDKKELITYVFDACLFGGAVIILYGVFDEDLEKLISNTEEFLIVGGMAGVSYSVKALFTA